MKTGKITPMRTKEEAHDYRYFPDPDLIPLTISDRQIEDIRGALPEMPVKRRARFVEQYGLREYDATVLTHSKTVADFFEDTVALVKDSRMVSNWIQTEILRICKEKSCNVSDLRVNPQSLADLLALVKGSTINASTAKEVLNSMVATGDSPRAIVDEKGLAQVSSDNQIAPMIESLLQENPKEVEAYRNGKTKLISFFVGEVMKATKGKANPAVVNRILKQKLDMKPE